MITSQNNRFSIGGYRSFLIAAALCGASAAFAALPSGYTEVDYIASSGTQYIDTGGDAASKRTMCDILGVNTLANGRRTPILFTSPAAKRDPSFIANGELLGDVALRLMLQRIAYPEHPPCELYLDIPGEAAKTSSRNKKRTKT